MLIELFEKYNNFACVGRRDFAKTDDLILCQMIGYVIACNNKNVISGNAKGADQAFANGLVLTDKLSNLFLYVTNSQMLIEKQFKNANILKEFNNAFYIVIAKECYGDYERLKEYTKFCMNRNAAIIYNSDVVIAFPNRENYNWGGTGHSMRVANYLKKPVIDLSDSKVYKEIKREVKIAARNYYNDSI